MACRAITRSLLNGAVTSQRGVSLRGEAGNYKNTVTFNDDISATSSYGVRIYGGNEFGATASFNTVTLKNNSTMNTASGIAIRARYVYDNIVDLTGNLYSTGGRGVYLRSYIGGADRNTITFNGGTLTAQYNAVGLYSYGSVDNNVVDLTGTVTATTGYGVRLFSSGSSGTSNDVTLNSGTFMSYRSGVYMYGAVGLYTNDVDLNTGAALSTSGAAAHGVHLKGAYLGGNAVTLNGSASISTIGAGAHGVLMENVSSNNNNVYLNGTSSISVTGVGADGINMAVLDGSHSVTLAQGTSVYSKYATGIYGGVGVTTVTTGGTITGGGGTSVFLNDGNDTLILQTGSSLNSIADGGADTDDLVLNGTGSEDSDFVNFETLTMNGDEWTLSGLIDLGGGGTTTIQLGKLHVDGTLTSPTVTVDPTGILGGMGTIVGDVTNNGIIMPDIGDLAIDGNVVFTTGSSLAVTIDMGTATQVNATGTATIDTGSSVILTGELAMDVQTTILTSSGVTGLFDSVEDDVGDPIPSVVASEVGGTDVVLEVITMAVGEVTNNAAGSTNQDAFRGFANSILDRIDDNNMDDDPVGSANFALAGTFNNRISDTIGPDGLDPFSNALGAPVTSHLSSFTQMALQADSTSADQAAAAASFLPGFGIDAGSGGLWVKGFANFSRQHEDSRNVGYDAVTGGVSIGLDTMLANTNTLVGGVLGYARSNADLDMDAGEVDLDTFYAGFYSSTNLNAWIINLMVTGGYSNYDSERMVTDGEIAGFASDKFNGYLFDVRGELARTFSLTSNTALRPRLAVEHLWSHQDDYEDDGAGIVDGLMIDDHTTKLLRLEGQLDLKFANMDVGSKQDALDAILFAGAAYEDYTDSRLATASIVGLGDTIGLSLGDDNRVLALVGAKVNYQIDTNFTFHLGYNAELENDFHRHNLMAGVRYEW